MICDAALSRRVVALTLPLPTSLSSPSLDDMDIAGFADGNKHAFSCCKSIFFFVASPLTLSLAAHKSSFSLRASDTGLSNGKPWSFNEQSVFRLRFMTTTPLSLNNHQRDTK
jgi:hypothetical protein